MKEEGLLQEKKISTPRLIGRIFHYTKGERLKIAFAFFLLLLQLAINLTLPLAMERFVDAFNATSQERIISFVVGLAIGYGILAIVGQAIRVFEGDILQEVGQKVVYRLRMEVFSHIESLSQNQFNEVSVGALVTRVANYTSNISNLFSDVLVNFISNVLTILAVYIAMAVLNWKLSLVILAFAILIGILSFFAGKKLKKQFASQRSDTSLLNSFLSESLQGMGLIEAFHQEAKKRKEFVKKNESLRKSAYGVNLIFAFYRPLLSFFYYCALAATFYFGTLFAFSGGEIVAFYLFLSRFFRPIEELSDQLNQIEDAFSCFEKIFNLLDIEPEVNNPPHPIVKEHFEGKIEFQHVWFAYEGENWVLQDVSFVVEPGESLAIVGPTGAGKSTIMGLIVRNFVPQKGKILLDDIDVNLLDGDCLRKRVGQMMQEVTLFSGSIESNLTIHDPSFSEEQVKKAASFVGADSFIEKLPKGYETELSENGSNLSTGQRQLLSFARTILHQPEILILDEATANIDAETEAVIQASLKKMKTLGTMLLVAHRLSTIQNADKILVLSKGKIAEEGTHQELLKKKGLYYRLYQIQEEKVGI